MLNNPVSPSLSHSASQLRTLLKRTGLSRKQAALELDLDEAALDRWCAGKSRPPAALIYALHYLADGRTDDDAAAIAAACRMAAQNAAQGAGQMRDFVASRALLEAEARYTRLAFRFETARNGTYACGTRPDAGLA